MSSYWFVLVKIYYICSIIYLDKLFLIKTPLNLCSFWEYFCKNEAALKILVSFNCTLPTHINPCPGMFDRFAPFLVNRFPNVPSKMPRNSPFCYLASFSIFSLTPLTRILQRLNYFHIIHFFIRDYQCRHALTNKLLLNSCILLNSYYCCCC